MQLVCSLIPLWLVYRSNHLTRGMLCGIEVYRESRPNEMLVRRWSAHQTPAYDRLSAAKDIPGRWKVYKDVSWLAAECSPGPRGLRGALEARHHPGGCCNGIAESPAGSRLAVPSLSKCARGHPVPVYHFSEYFPSTSFDIYNKIPET